MKLFVICGIGFVAIAALTAIAHFALRTFFAVHAASLASLYESREVTTDAKEEIGYKQRKAHA